MQSHGGIEEMMPAPDLATTLRLTLIIASFGLLLSAREYLTTPALLQDSGLMSWQVQRVSLKRVTPGIVLVCLHAVLAYPQVQVLITIQAVCAALLVLGATFAVLSANLTLVLVWGCALTSLLLAIRSPYGRDGSDQMSTIIFVTLGLTLVFKTPLMQEVGLWFLAYQCCLSYCSAGFAKVFSPVWRSGEALPGILATARYGYFPLARWLRSHPRFTLLLTWQTFGIETLFPLVLIGPRWLTLLLLIWGLGFHLFNVLFMGLARFLWAFTACYPAIWWCSAQLSLWR